MVQQSQPRVLIGSSISIKLLDQDQFSRVSQMKMLFGGDGEPLLSPPVVDGVPDF